MGDPDDAARAEFFRRGSPVYRAERIEAPLLLLHGRKDKRVVPLMTERMVEALEIEGKRHEVHWYDDEGHGWERRENRRDAFKRILAFLKAHVLDEPDGAAPARPHRERDRVRDADADEDVAEAEHVGERQPGRQAKTSVKGPSAGSATTMLFVYPLPRTPMAASARAAGIQPPLATIAARLQPAPTAMTQRRDGHVPQDRHERLPWTPT